MDSGNSGSISSSGDEEYDSRPHHHHHQTLLPSSTFLNHHQPPQFGSLLPHHQNHPSNFFDLSSTYLHSLSQPQQQNTFLNLDSGTSQTPRSELDCTAPGASSSPSPSTLQLPPHQGLAGYGVAAAAATDPSNNAARLAAVSSSPRNPKKRTRASRRAPTTVLTTDTSNFRAMVQEFTGIPAPPFSGSSYSRRLDLLTAGSSSLRSNNSSHFDTAIGNNSFYPLRPSPQRLHHHHQNQNQNQNALLFPSSSSLLHNSNMVDANAAIGLASTTTNNSSSNNSVNYQQQHHQQLSHPHDLGLPYNHNTMLSMQNHPILSFHPSSQQHLHPFGIGVFSAKSQAGLSLQSLQDLGVGQSQVNAHLLATEGDGGGGGDGSGGGDPLMSLDGSYGGGGKDDSGGGGGGCKMNFSGGAGSSTLNHEKTLENNNNSGGGGGGGRGEGSTAVDSWICSSD